MTREEGKEMLPIIQAFIEGKEIQVFDDEKGWVETEYLIFNLSPNCYRIKPEPKKFDPKTLQPFDKVLAKIGTERYYTWFPDFISFPPNDINDKIACVGKDVVFMAIPYNDETKHLIDTNEEAPEYYKYWED